MATTGGQYSNLATYTPANLLNNGFTSPGGIIDTTVTYTAAGNNYASTNPNPGNFDLTFEFPSAAELDGMHVWNYTYRMTNGSGSTTPGVNAYTLTFYDGPGGSGSTTSICSSDSRTCRANTTPTTTPTPTRSPNSTPHGCRPWWTTCATTSTTRASPSFAANWFPGYSFAGDRATVEAALADLPNQRANTFCVDNDHDGTNNLLEYAFLTDPSRATATPPPGYETVAIPGEGEFPAISFRQRFDTEAPRYVVEVSSDLAIWTSNLDGPTVTATVGSPVDNGDGTSTVTVRHVTPVSAAAPTLFLRVRVISN